ncbi:Increased recombination centers protein 6 [[Candida] zeylanoides]
MTSHVLVVGGPHSGKLRACRAVGADGAAVGAPPRPHSGLILPFALDTKYYHVDGKLFVDEFDAAAEWSAEFLADDMRELRDVLEGFVLCVDTANGAALESVEMAASIRSRLDAESDGEWRGFVVVVGTVGSAEAEDAAAAHGFEFVALSDAGRNEYRDKIGVDRLREVFEAHPWRGAARAERPDAYEQRQRRSVESQLEPLLTDRVVDLDAVLAKLQVAKRDIAAMDDHQKEARARAVIDDLMAYI